MAADLVVAVAAHLAGRPERQRHVPLGSLTDVVDDAENAGVDRENAAADVQAAVERLDRLGLVAMVHHVGAPAVIVLHWRELRRIAAGEPLPAVAAEVERTRPLTVIRISPGRWAAWYQSTLRLPVGAALGVADDGAGVGCTADEAVAELQARAREALSPTWAITSQPTGARMNRPGRAPV
jgi:hypothetical protein